MIKIKHFSLIFSLFITLLSATASSEGFIKKEIYSFEDKNGNTVFTDRLPAKKQTFKTQTIEAANSTENSNAYNQDYANSKRVYKDLTYLNSNQPQTVRIIVEDGHVTKKKSYKKKPSLKRCKTYKKKFTYYSNKMKAGYKNSEYNKLESNRKKYKNLLFNNCETKTFND